MIHRSVHIIITTIKQITAMSKKYEEMEGQVPCIVSIIPMNGVASSNAVIGVEVSSNLEDGGEVVDYAYHASPRQFLSLRART